MTPRESANTFWLFIAGEVLIVFFRFGTFSKTVPLPSVVKIYWWKVSATFKAFEFAPWFLSNVFFLVFQVICYAQWGFESLIENSFFVSFVQLNIFIIGLWMIFFIVRIIKNIRTNPAEIVRSGTAFVFDGFFLISYLCLLTMSGKSVSPNIIHRIYSS